MSVICPFGRGGWTEGKIPMQIAAHYLADIKQEGVDYSHTWLYALSFVKKNY